MSEEKMKKLINKCKNLEKENKQLKEVLSNFRTTEDIVDNINKLLLRNKKNRLKVINTNKHDLLMMEEAIVKFKEIIISACKKNPLDPNKYLIDSSNKSHPYSISSIIQQSNGGGEKDANLQ